MTWDRNKIMCSNCLFWALSPYGQGQWERGEEPSGVAGYHTDGTASECHAKPPERKQTEYTPGRNAAWPHTEKGECCGAFVLRPS
jgi:hypothetical protein